MESIHDGERRDDFWKLIDHMVYTLESSLNDVRTSSHAMVNESVEQALRTIRDVDRGVMNGPKKLQLFQGAGKALVELDQLFVQQHVEAGHGHRRTQRVSAEGAAMVAGPKDLHDILVSNEGTHGVDTATQ